MLCACLGLCWLGWGWGGAGEGPVSSAGEGGGRIIHCCHRNNEVVNLSGQTSGERQPLPFAGQKAKMVPKG